MKLLITTLTIIFISFGANSSDNEYFRDCKKLKNNIEFNIYNYFANFEKENLRKEPDHKERALNFLDLANKQANIYTAICTDEIKVGAF
jgi:hypothetical protein